MYSLWELEEFMKLNKTRKLNPQEEKLLEELIVRSNKNILSTWKSDLIVSSLDDGGMGSLALFPGNTINEDRHFGSQVSECQFRDVDGVLVIASLYLDKDDKLFEMNIWKVYFINLIKIPSHFKNVSFENSNILN